jgi:hypothetical protein
MKRLVACPDGNLLGVDQDSNLHVFSTEFVLERQLTRKRVLEAQPFKKAAVVDRYAALSHAVTVNSQRVLAIMRSGRHPVTVSPALDECENVGLIRSDVGEEQLLDLASNEDAIIWGLNVDGNVLRFFKPDSSKAVRDKDENLLHFDRATHLCFVAGGLFVLCQQQSKCGWRAWGHSILLDADGIRATSSRVELPGDAHAGLPYVSCSGSGSNLCLVGSDVVVTFDVLNVAWGVRKILRDAQGHTLASEVNDAVELDGQLYIATKTYGVVRAASKKQEQQASCAQQ